MATIREKRRKQDQMAIMIGVAVVLLVGGIAILYVKFSPPSINVETNCLADDGPDAYTAIVIDQSESLENAKVRSIRGLFDALLKGNFEDAGPNAKVFLDFNQRAFANNAQLQLYVMNEDTIDSIAGIDPIVSKCLGPWGAKFKGIAGLFVSPKLVTEARQEVIDRFDEEITALLTSPRGMSPIMEMTAAISTSEFATNSDKPHYLIMVSDMIQETSDYSHRRDGTDFNQWKTNHRAIHGDLRQTEYQIIYLTRESDKNIQTIGHQLFWEQFLSYLNASQGYFNLQ